MEFTYPSSSLVIMQIHFLPQISSPLSSIDKFPAEFETKIYVIRAAAPVPFAGASPSPSATGGGCAGYLGTTPVVRVVTVAGADGTFAAGAGYGMGDGGAGYCVDEGGFSTTCKKEKCLPDPSNRFPMHQLCWQH